DALPICYFAPREELLAYLKKVAIEHDVRSHIRFNTRLTASRWNESKRRWISSLETGNGLEDFESTTLVSAIGQLNDPSPAHFKGEEEFAGLKLHSALWSFSPANSRSEEHTSELQSRFDLVCRLLLEK